MSTAVALTQQSHMVSLAEMEKMADAFAQSGLFGFKTKTQALALMMIAQAEGIPPALAARDYHIVNGKPSLKADAMLARFQQAGGTIKWLSLTDERAAATFTHQAGGSVTIDWTFERASKVEEFNGKTNQWGKLTDKHTWKSYPRQMLRSRVISEGIRTVFPGVVAGIYSTEEVQDMTDLGPEPMKDVTPKPDAAPAEPKGLAAKTEKFAKAAAMQAPLKEAEIIQTSPVDQPKKKTLDWIGEDGNVDEFTKISSWIKWAHDSIAVCKNPQELWDQNITIRNRIMVLVDKMPEPTRSEAFAEMNDLAGFVETIITNDGSEVEA